MTAHTHVESEDWRFSRLRWSLQALAAQPEDQLALFPSFTSRVEELALEFDEHYRRAIAELSPAMDADQLEALRSIDAKLESMSADGPEFAESLWEALGLRNSPHWDDVRSLAAEALARFHWPVELPPEDPAARGSVYVGGDT